jgi:hypothetical protein
MTVAELVTNPPGKSTRHVSARYREILALEHIYRQALADPARAARFRLEAWKTGPETFLARVKVPSEKNGTDFDVVLLLAYGGGTTAPTSKADVKVYCNSPGWIFTYGYVAAQRGLLVPGWAGALGREVATTPPRVTNPDLSYGFDKVVQQAAYYLLGRGGMLNVGDANRIAANTRGPRPAPRQPGVAADEKLAEYERNEQARAAAARKGRQAKAKSAAAAEAARKAEERAAAERRAAGTKPAGTPTAKAKATRGTKPASAAKAAKTAKAARAAPRAGSRRRTAG